MALWDDVHIPYAVNFWSEPPLLVQIHRIASGQAAYLPPYTADSWTYGPFYGYLLATLDRLFERKPSIVTLRLISIYIGYLTVVPLVLALVGLRLRRSPAAGWGSTVIAASLTVTLFGILDMRALSFSALHPDVLTFLIVATALAAVVWYPLVRNRTALMAALCLVCFAGALTKLNLAPLIAFFVAALALEGFLRWRIVAAIVGAFALSLVVFYLLAPSALREWTVVIPAHHWYAMPSYWLPKVWREWTAGQRYQGSLLLGTLGALAFLGARGRGREAAAWACMLGGIFAAGYQGMAKQGGGVNDLWFLYVACLIPSGAAVDDLLRIGGERLAVLLTARAVTLAYLSLLVSSVPAAANWPAQLPLEGLAALNDAAARLRLLCEPGRKIIVTWFVDPFIDCPGAQLSTWDSVGEILIARSHGYRARIFLDDPIGDATLIDYLPNSVPHRFSTPHAETPVIMWEGYSYGYGGKELDVWTPRSQDAP